MSRNGMNLDVKLERKRLLIYLALSFGLTWIIFLSYILTGHRWDGSDQNMESFVGLGMLMPFIAHILTRWITKEGFAMTGKDSMMLGISLRDKKWVWYIIALFGPWIYFELGYGMMLLAFPDIFDKEQINSLGVDNRIVYVLPVIVILSGAVTSFAALGEEAGWRAYMMPKLIKLMGEKKACILGGIIWGLWHAPLTCAGHNFGTDYPGFPYVGIALMCADCVFMGIILTFITLRSGSVWPAAIMHAVNNTNPGILRFFVNSQQLTGASGIAGWVLLLLPNIIAGSVCLVIMCRGNKDKKEQ